MAEKKTRKPRTIITIDDKIAKQSEIVEKAKARYDQAVEKLNELETKKQELDHKELLDIISQSGKTTEEIIELLRK